jgi:MauM/NapG family ferredoxin protein
VKTIKFYAQLFFFLLFTASFFIAVSYPLAYTLDCRWLLRVNPLPVLLTFIASRKIITGSAVLLIAVCAITIIFGRIFCGFFCPLGATIDFVDNVFFKKADMEKRRPPQHIQKLKYILLTILITIAAGGALFPLFTDPVSLFTRIATVFAYPLPAITGSLITPLQNFISAEHTNIPLFYGSAGIGLLFLAIISGAYWDRRFWCQYICPSGAFLGLLSRFALFRRNISGKDCTFCEACVKICPTRAINKSSPDKTLTSECILCGKCTALQKKCQTFSITTKKNILKQSLGPDAGKREFLAGIAAGAMMLPVLKADAMSRRDNTGRLIRPPGAIPETLFNSRCIACGQCMKVCPANTLQPCVMADGFFRMATPKVVPRIGGCEEKCHICGHVCPTGAIRKLTREEKRFAKIGTAVVDRNRCLAWEQNKECLVCVEVCPYNAIESVTVETTKGRFTVPVVDEDLCMGCGMCEQQCPVFDTAAIVVYKFGENRIAYGSYISEARKKSMLEKRTSSDSLDNTGLETKTGRLGSDVKKLPPDSIDKKDHGETSSGGFSF